MPSDVTSAGFPEYLRAYDPTNSEKDVHACALLARAGTARVPVLEVSAVSGGGLLLIYGHVHD